MTESIAPELLAAAAERPALQKSSAKFKLPSLNDLVTKAGAVAAMLRAIMNFLKLRFPAFLGMNVLYSLALFGLFSQPTLHSPNHFSRLTNPCHN